MSVGNDYLPSREADLVTWSANLLARLQAGGPTPYGLPGPTTAAYLALHNLWTSSFTAANSDITRTPVSITAKNTSKQNHNNGVNAIRQLVNIVQANPATTDEDRAELQITVRDAEPSPVPIPTIGPGLSVLSQLGRTAKIRLRDIENPDSRAKPGGVFGATLFYFIGDAAPTDPVEWTFLINSTRTLVDIEWPLAVDSGSRVWLTGFWFNMRGQSSPASAEAISLRVGDQMAQAA